MTASACGVGVCMYFSLQVPGVGAAQWQGPPEPRGAPLPVGTQRSGQGVSPAGPSGSELGQCHVATVRPSHHISGFNLKLLSESDIGMIPGRLEVRAGPWHWQPQADPESEAQAGLNLSALAKRDQRINHWQVGATGTGFDSTASGVSQAEAGLKFQLKREPHQRPQAQAEPQPDGGHWHSHNDRTPLLTGSARPTGRPGRTSQKRYLRMCELDSELQLHFCTAVPKFPVLRSLHASVPVHSETSTHSGWRKSHKSNLQALKNTGTFMMTPQVQV